MNNSKDRHFTVVIPTRERSDTLEHALHTCVIQDYDDLEILVSDNFSQDRTREVVESYKDSRIRYINTGKRLSMSDNFEYALSYVNPRGYVIYLGDDDGLLPNAIHDINALLLKTRAQVLRWDVASYFWPKLESVLANRLNIPSIKSKISTHESATTIEKVLSFEVPYQSLPVMYMYSAIAYDIIDKIKSLSGRFYHSMTPDVYSGFAIAGSVNSFVYSTRPYVIGGASHHSNGASGAGASSSKALLMYLSEDNLAFHHTLVQCTSIDEYVFESFLQAQDHLPFFDKISFDMKKLIIQMMITAAARPEAIYNEIKDAVLQLGEIHNISDVAQKAIDLNPHNGQEQAKKSILSRLKKLNTQKIGSYLKNKYDRSISIDCSTLNINNIYDASVLCGHIFGLNDKKMLKNPAYVRLLNKVKFKYIKRNNKSFL